jgi:hypothetical protein
MMRKGLTTALLAFALFTFSVASGEAAAMTVTLSDGRILEVSGVELDGGLYLLERPSGEVLSIPSGLVVQIQVRGSAQRVPDRPAVDLDRRPRDLPGESAHARWTPRTLAGYSARFTDPLEQLRVFGAPALFPRGPIDPYYEPKSDWDLGNLEQAPSTSMRPSTR